MFELSRAKKFLFALTFIALVGGACFGLGRWYFFLTDGFGPHAITSDFSYDSSWEIAALAPERQGEIYRILDQKYSYMAKGTECYVLESKDGVYVMKFFKQKHIHLPWWQKIGSYLPLVGPYAQEALHRREKRKDSLYASCKFGYEQCAEETGIIFLHLNPSDDLPNNIMIFDKLGYRHFVDLNSVAFYLQRRGVPLQTVLLSFKHSNDIEGASKALEGLFAHFRRLSDRGIIDRDPNMLHNLGFLDGVVVNLDPGGLRLEASLTPSEESINYMKKNSDVIRGWILAYFPELLSTYDQLSDSFFQDDA